MREIKVFTINGETTEQVYTISELPMLDKMLQCKDSKKKDINYLNIPCAFDIEATNIYQKDSDGNILPEPRPYAFMYQWQFCLDDCVCFGRTWEEFQLLIDNLEKRMNLSLNNRLVVFVHNLPYEWAFMNRFIHYQDGFWREDRKPLKILTKEGIEFRCSYALSNMSLNKFCQNEEGVTHYKLSGDEYNYNKTRTPFTPLTELEEAYCYNDVRGLCECIQSLLRFDTLSTLPLTKTGFVRRDMRNAVKGNKKYRDTFRNNALDKKLYSLCREAFRGGDTHANLDYSNQTLHNGHGRDIRSSYPTQMMLKPVPQTAFFKLNVSTYLNRDISDYALLLEVRFCNINYIGKCGIPYIPYAKCRSYTSDRIIDNGRILSASVIECVITDIDMDIIKTEYSYTDIYIKEIWASRYAPLDDSIKNVIMEYYRKKTLFDGIPEKAYERNKSKNSLNASYGCMVMRIDQTEISYNPKTLEYSAKEQQLEEVLAKFYKSRNSFLSYQHGLWITSWARKQLRDMLQVVGSDTIYCDTDSIKYLGEHEEEFEAKNREIEAEAIKAGAFAEDSKGNIKVMGLWTPDGEYEEFRTLGAKKYVYKEAGKIHSTIAGVNKKIGSEYFQEKGIEAFRIGETIKDSGHLTAYYNDDNIHQITVDHHKFTTASNVALIDNSYTIGVTNEYLDLLEKAVAKMEDMDYI